MDNPTSIVIMILIIVFVAYKINNLTKGGG